MKYNFAQYFIINHWPDGNLFAIENACLCLCAGEEINSMNAFRQLALRLNPSFNVQKRVLKAKDYTLSWHPGMDDTQYL